MLQSRKVYRAIALLLFEPLLVVPVLRGPDWPQQDRAPFREAEKEVAPTKFGHRALCRQASPAVTVSYTGMILCEGGIEFRCGFLNASGGNEMQ